MSKDHFIKLPDQHKQAVLNSGKKAFSQKSYGDVSTEEITRNCGISKGLLFHYFGSKQAFYFSCLESSLETLSKEPALPDSGDVYEILYALVENRITLYHKYPEEARVLAMATKETSTDVRDGKNAILIRYLAKSKADFTKAVMRASDAITAHSPSESIKNTAALLIYTNALMRIYVEKFQDRPEVFFKNSERIQLEFKDYIDVMLYGMMRKR
jgi:TetR/AcrR family transcriptional regulator